MNRVVKILMERDGLTREEAEREAEILTGDIILAAEDGCYEEAEDILLDAGFELDYLDDLLF